MTIAKVALKQCIDCRRITFGDNIFRSTTLRRGGCSCESPQWNAIFWEYDK